MEALKAADIIACTQHQFRKRDASGISINFSVTGLLFQRYSRIS